MLFLHGLGHFHPENVIDNAFLESLDIGTDDHWIRERVGIRERRTVLSLDYIRATRNRDPRAAAEASRYSNAQTAALAARHALTRAGLRTTDIGMVIAGGSSPQHLIPAEACIFAAELGIAAPALDVSSACSSFAAQLHLLDQMRPEALPDFVLLVSAENMTRTIDYTDRKSAVLWGDGTSAAIVSSRVPARARITRTTFASDPTGWDKVVIPAGGFFTQDGPAVQRFAILRAGAVLDSLRAGVDAERLYFVGHQANLLMLEAVARRGGLAATHHLHNVERFGNCGAAGAPGVLSQRWDEVGPGDVVAMAVVGSGLSWGGVLIESGAHA